MVKSGYSIQRAFLGAVLTILFSVSTICLRADEPGEVAGTMPEDYLPDLKRILAQALQRAPEVIAKDFERLTHEARYTIARASRLPQVGGGFNYGFSQTAEAGNRSSQYRDSGFFYNFGVSQALFHWGALANQSASARIAMLVGEKSYALAYRELSATLRKAYLALIVEKARLQQVAQLVELVRRDVAIAQAKLEDGSVSGAAVASEALRLREQELELRRVQEDFAANRSRFARLAGLPELAADAVPLEIPRPAFSEPRTAAMTAALLRDNAKSTLEFEIHDLRVREAMLREKIEKTRLLPKFGLNANYSLENTTNVNGNLAEQRAVARQTIGLGGSWNLFDGLATRGVRREALAERRALEHRRSVEAEQLQQDAQILARRLAVDAELVDVADIRHGTATEGHRLTAQEVSFGNIPRLDAERAQVNVLLAKVRSLEARASFLSHWTEFVAIAGRDPVLSNLPDRHVRKTK